MIYLKYLKSLLRHKWFVFVECCKLGIPWLGIIHDLSKFSPDEFFAYSNRFFGGEDNRNKWGRSWLHHQHFNKHHPEFYIVGWRGDSSFYDDVCYKIPNYNIAVFSIPDRYRREMLADWRGAGRAYGNPDTKAWYLKNCENIILHDETRRWIEEQLGVMEG